MGLQLEVVKPSSFGASIAWGKTVGTASFLTVGLEVAKSRRSHQGYGESSTSRYLPCLGSVRPCWYTFQRERFRKPYNRGVRDAGWSAGDSGRDGSESVELQRAFAAASRFDPGPSNP